MNKVAVRIILAHIIIGLLAVLSETFIFKIDSIQNPKVFDKTLFAGVFLLLYMIVGYLLSRNYSMKKVLKTSILLMFFEIAFILAVIVGVKVSSGVITENIMFLLLVSMFYNYNIVNILSSLDFGISLYGAIPIAIGVIINYNIIIMGSFIEYRTVSRTKLLNRINNL